VKKLQLGIGSSTYFWVTLKTFFTQSTVGIDILSNCLQQTLSYDIMLKTNGINNIVRIGDGRRFHQDVPLGTGSGMDHKLVDLVMG
jgi:hypothetical protein